MILCHPYWPSCLSVVCDSFSQSHLVSEMHPTSACTCSFSPSQRGRKPLLCKAQLPDFKYFIRPLFSLTCRTWDWLAGGEEGKKTLIACVTCSSYETTESSRSCSLSARVCERCRVTRGVFLI